MKNLFIALLIMAANVANAQSFSDIQNKKGKKIFTESRFKIYAAYVAAESKLTPSYSGYTPNISIFKNEAGKGGTRVKYENPTLGDLMWLAKKVYKVPQTVISGQVQPFGNNPSKDHAHGSGFLGWAQWYYNVVGKDNLLFSAGVSGGDYIYASRVNGQYQDPSGYYLAAGPALMASYVPAKWCWIDVYANYDLSFLNGAKKTNNPNYSKPHFLTIGTDFNTSKQFFFGIRHNTMLDQGTSNDAASRLDIKLGIIL